MGEETKIIDDTSLAESVRRNLQNRIIGILILYFGAFLIFLTAGSQGGLFPYLLTGFLIINTGYLALALVKLSQLKDS